MPALQVAVRVAFEGIRPVPPAAACAALVRVMTACWAEEPAKRPDFAALVETLQAALLAERKGP